jgi:hypothetical protein
VAAAAGWGMGGAGEVFGGGQLGWSLRRKGVCGSGAAGLLITSGGTGTGSGMVAGCCMRRKGVSVPCASRV